MKLFETQQWFPKGGRGAGVIANPALNVPEYRGLETDNQVVILHLAEYFQHKFPIFSCLY